MDMEKTAVQEILEKYANLSVRDLEAKIGVPFPTLARWRRGEVTPRAYELNTKIKLAQTDGNTERVEVLQALLKAIE